MEISIRTRYTGYGDFDISIFKDYENLGKFVTNDTQLIEDIYEMNAKGYESNLVMHETFKEVIQNCLSKLEDMNSERDQEKIRYFRKLMNDLDISCNELREFLEEEDMEDKLQDTINELQELITNIQEERGYI